MKYVYFEKWAKCFANESDAWTYVNVTAPAKVSGCYVLKGADKVTKKGDFYFVASVLLGKNVVVTSPAIGYTDWT